MRKFKCGDVYVSKDDIVSGHLKDDAAKYIVISIDPLEFGQIGTNSVYRFKTTNKLLKLKFLKSDLSYGDFVTLRNNAIYLVMHDMLVSINNLHDKIPINTINDDLNSINDSKFDIVEVGQLDPVTKSGFAIWIRDIDMKTSSSKSVVDMTLKEIETALGHKVRIIG